VANSLRFNSGSSDSLTRSTTAGNRTTWTFSTWFKRSKLGVLQSILEHDDSNYFRVRITSGDVFEVFDSNTNKLWSWHPLLRDTSAWYHIVIRGDSTDGTNANRLRLYINGTLASANAVASIDQNYTFSFNQGGTLQIGKRGSTDYLDGYLAETILIDGSALAPDEFGEFDEDSGIWKPINVSGLTFGTRGFYLEFKESGTSANSSGLVLIYHCISFLLLLSKVTFIIPIAAFSLAVHKVKIDLGY
ncbi:LamG domain-containing protein, partial [bacterium]|nr:LamG domain-containing protein [bacterium]